MRETKEGLPPHAALLKDGADVAPARPDLRGVRFTGAVCVLPYRRGELAGFPPEEALLLVVVGAAAPEGWTVGAEQLELLRVELVRRRREAGLDPREKPALSSLEATALLRLERAEEERRALEEPDDVSTEEEERHA